MRLGMGYRKYQRQIIAFVITAVLITASGCGQGDKGQSAPQQQAATAAPQQPEGQGTAVKIYRPDADGEFVLGYDDTVSEVTGDALVGKLIEKGVLDKEVSLNHIEEKQNAKKKLLLLDFNQAFQDQLSASGSAGERNLIASVTNTFLDAFSADKVKYTVDGKPLEGGHRDYSQAQKKYDVAEETYVDATIQEDGKKKTIEVKRVAVDGGLAFNYDAKNFRFIQNKKKNTFRLESKKKTADGNPLAYLRLEPCERSLEEEIGSMMSQNPNGQYVKTDSVQIGEDGSIFCGRILCDPDKGDGYDRTFYILRCDTIWIWKMEVASSQDSLSARLQATLDSMKFIRERQ